MKKPPHECPPFCHVCPDLTGAIRSAGREPEPGEDVLPGCWSNLGANPDWRGTCACEKMTRREADAMTREIEELEAYLADLRAMGAAG